MMAEKLGEAFVLLGLRDAAFRAQLKSDETFAAKSAATISALLGKIQMPRILFSIDTKHLQKSVDVAEAIVGSGMEKMRKLSRVPAYLDARPMRRSIGTVTRDVSQGFALISRYARVRPALDSRAMRSELNDMRQVVQQQMQQMQVAMRRSAMNSMQGMAAEGVRGRAPSRFARGASTGGGGGGGLGVGGALLAGATGGLAATAGIKAFGMLEMQVKGLIRTGMGANAQMEGLKVSFEQMLGSATAGERVLESLRKFAEQTPFELKDISQVATMLLATKQVAENQLIPIIRKLGDAASGSVEGFAALPRITRAVTQMMNKGKIQAEEMLQLSEAGVPAWQALASAMGKTVPEVQKMSEQGKLGLNEIMKLVDGLGGQFDGLAAKQSRTFGGLSSTWRDQLSQAVMKVSKPLFELSKLGLENLVDWMNTPKAQRLIDVLTQGMTEVAGKVKVVGLNVIEALKGFDLSIISNAITKTISVATRVGEVLKAAFNNPIVMAISKFALLSGAVSAAIGIASTFAPTILAALSPVGATVLAITAGFTLLKKSLTAALESPSGRKLRENMEEILSRARSLGENLRGSIGPLLDTVGGKLSKVFSFGTGAGSFWETASAGLREVITIVETLSANWNNSWNAAKLIGNATILEWWEKIKHFFTVQWPEVALGFWEGMAAASTQWAQSFLETMKVIFDSAKEMFQSIFVTKKNQFQATGDAFKSAWSKTGEDMLQARERARSAIETTRAAGGSKSDAMKAAAAELAVGIDNALGNYLGAGGTALKAATVGVGEELNAMGTAAKKIADQFAKADAEIATAFGAPIAERFSKTSSAPVPEEATRMRAEADKLLGENKSTADAARKRRDSEAKARDVAERDKAGKAGIEGWISATKSALVAAGMSVKDALAGEKTFATTPGKKAKVEFTSSSELYKKMAESLMPKTTPHETKVETLLDGIKRVLDKMWDKSAGSKIPGVVAGGMLGAGRALGKGIADPGSVLGKVPGALSKGIGSAVEGIKSGAGWLSKATAGMQMDPAVAEAIKKENAAKESEEFWNFPERFESKNGGMATRKTDAEKPSGIAAAKQKLMDQLSGGAQSAKQTLMDQLGGGSEGASLKDRMSAVKQEMMDRLNAQEAPAVPDTIAQLKDRMANIKQSIIDRLDPQSSGATGGQAEDPMMKRQNEILEKGLELQRQVLGVFSGMSVNLGFGV